jgi:hypothetical protein
MVQQLTLLQTQSKHSFAPDCEPLFQMAVETTLTMLMVIVTDGLVGCLKVPIFLFHNVVVLIYMLLMTFLLFMFTAFLIHLLKLRT